jgi:hypothetical protein
VMDDRLQILALHTPESPDCTVLERINILLSKNTANQVLADENYYFTSAPFCIMIVDREDWHQGAW